MTATQTITKEQVKKILEEIASEIDKEYEKMSMRWVWIEFEDEDNKIKIWRNQEVIKELENISREDIENDAIDSAFYALDTALDKFKDILEYDTTENDDPWSVETIGSYGNFVSYIVDREIIFKDKRMQELAKEVLLEEEIKGEYCTIYYDYITDSIIVFIRQQVSAYEDEHEGKYVLSEEFIKNELGLNPELFEKF